MWAMVIYVRRYCGIHYLEVLEEITSNHVVSAVVSYFSYASVAQVPVMRDDRAWARRSHVIPMASTSHQSYGLQVLRIVLIGLLILSNEPTKLRLVFEYEATKLGRHIGKPIFVTGSPRIAQIP
jgi:hypothetical protein